jgi:histidyl-tRNA synthetase
MLTIWRVISIQKARGETKGRKLRSTDVFVMALGNASSSGMATQRMEITSQLRRQGIRARTFPGVKWRNEKQFKAADSAGAILSIILGEDEAAQGKLRLKRMGLEDGHPEKNGVLIDKTDVASEVKKMLERVRLEEATAGQVESLRLS